MDRPKVFFAFTNPTEDAVVWPDKKLLRAVDEDRPSIRTYSGVDYRHVNRVRRETLVTGKQIKSPGPDVLGWNLVSNINDGGSGIDGENRALHRADEIILRAEVSQESNDRWFQVSGSGFKSPTPKLFIKRRRLRCHRHLRRI